MTVMPARSSNAMHAIGIGAYEPFRWEDRTESEHKRREKTEYEAGRRICRRWCFYRLAGRFQSPGCEPANAQAGASCCTRTGLRTRFSGPEPAAWSDVFNWLRLQRYHESGGRPYLTRSRTSAA